MTFRDWAKDLFNMFNVDNKTAEEYWEAAFDEGVKWTLQQDANTLNKIGLTYECPGVGKCEDPGCPAFYAAEECPECFRKEQE